MCLRGSIFFYFSTVIKIWKYFFHSLRRFYLDVYKFIHFVVFASVNEYAFDTICGSRGIICIDN